jgi:hypothetical protein
MLASGGDEGMTHPGVRHHHLAPDAEPWEQNLKPSAHFEQSDEAFLTLVQTTQAFLLEDLNQCGVRPAFISSRPG